MSQLHLRDSPDRERLLTEVATVVGDLLVDLDVDWRLLGVASMLPPDGEDVGLILDAPSYRYLPLADRLRTWICRHDVAHLDVRGADLVGLIGDYTVRTRAEAGWHRSVVGAVARGEYPSGRAIRGSHHSNTSLGSAQLAYRAEVLTDLGWVVVRRGYATARWVAPEGTIWWHAASPALQLARRRAIAARGAQ